MNRRHPPGKPSRRTPLYPGRPPRRKTRIRSRNPQRREQDLRIPVRLRAGRVCWIKAQACATCGAAAPSVNSHMRPRALYGRRVILPQCDRCHRLGRHSFAVRIGKTFEDLLALALEYEEHSRGPPGEAMAT